jgi:hypothetical protein
MLVLANLIATVAVLFVGIHPIANGPDPSWISGLYDDADTDTLLSVGAAKHISKGDLPRKVQGAAQILVCIAGLALANLSMLADDRFFGAGVRGPPEVIRKIALRVSLLSPTSAKPTMRVRGLPRTGQFRVVSGNFDRTAT